MKQSSSRRHILVSALVGVVLLGALAAPSRLLAEDLAIKIDRVSHVDHRLILFDEFDRRYHLSDGRYSNRDSVTLVIEKGRIAQVVGCGSGPCAIQAHATRIMDGKLSVYAEIEIVDGVYRRKKAADDDSEEISFEIADGKIVLLQDYTQRPKAVVAPDTSAPEPDGTDHG